MKHLVNNFFVGVVCLCCEVNSMTPETLYRGNVGSEHARTYIYPCKDDAELYFVGAVTVDVGNDNYPSAQEMLTQLNDLLTVGRTQQDFGHRGGGQGLLGSLASPRVIWSGSFHFLKDDHSCGWFNFDSLVKFYPMFNNESYLSNGRRSRSYFMAREEEGGRFDEFGENGILIDREAGYLHSSNGRAAIYENLAESSWEGSGSVRKIIDGVGKVETAYENRSLGIQALSMGEFLAGIGRSQGHDGHIRNRGKRFAPWCVTRSRETGKSFVDSVLSEFGKPEYN